MKTRGSVLFVSIAFVTVALLGFLMPEAEATVYHSGTINSDETWYAIDNPHVVCGHVTVADQVTLTIEAGAEVYFDTDKSIFVTGELSAQGTSSSYILFTSNESIKNPGDWGTIQINSSMGLPITKISYSIIKYATDGITDYRGIEISHNFITDNTRGVYVNDATPAIEYNTIVNSTNNGVDWTQPEVYMASGNIRYNNISDNGGKGVYLLQNAIPTIGYNTINSNYDGIYSVESGPDIIGNTISSNTDLGVYVKDYNNNSVQIRGSNVITNNACGIYALNATMLIWNNNVSSNTQGILLVYSPSKTENNTITSNTIYGIQAEKSNQTIYNNNLTNNGLQGIHYWFWRVTSPPGLDDTVFFQTVQDIQNNTITSNVAANGIYIENANVTIINNSATWFDSVFRMGIRLNYANGTITNNSIENNSYGIYCENLVDPEVHGNNIANNDDYGMYNDDSTITIDADYNWWGDDGGPHDPSDDRLTGGDYNWNPDGDKVSDYIDYREWLTVPAF